MATKWAILGTGVIANDFAVALKTLPPEDHQLVAVGSRSTHSARKFQDSHEIARAYGSYDEAIEDSEVQVVYIATIHPEHARLCELALNNGKHVLCEKPLAMNLVETERVLQLAQEKGLFMMEALWTRFTPAVLELQNQIKAGAIGTPKMVTAAFGAKILEVLPGFVQPELGGGAIINLATYVLNITDIVFGGEEPISMHAVGSKMESGVDHTVSLAIFYSDNRMAQLALSMGVELPNDAHIHGTEGSMTLEKPFWCSEKLMTPSGTKEFPLPPPGARLNLINSTGLRYEMEAVRQCILAGQTQSPIMSHDISRRIMGWMDNLRKQLGVVYRQDQE